jgi:hypothetical protein
MTPSELPDPALAAIHDGAAPLYFRHRPAYYNLIAKVIAGWSTASPGAVQMLVRDAQVKASHGAPIDAG